MEHKPEEMNNLLEVFAEAENRRFNQLLEGFTEKYKMISIRREVHKKDIDNIQYMHNRLGHPDVSESLEPFDIKSAEIYVFNDQLKDMVERIAVEMIRQGLIILDVEDSKYKPFCQLTMRVSVMNPRPSVRRLNIEKRQK